MWDVSSDPYFHVETASVESLKCGEQSCESADYKNRRHAILLLSKLASLRLAPSSSRGDDSFCTCAFVDGRGRIRRKVFISHVLSVGVPTSHASCAPCISKHLFDLTESSSSAVDILRNRDKIVLYFVLERSLLHKL